MASNQQKSVKNYDFDAIVAGAGFSGMYMLYRLREVGFSVRVYEAGDDVGGVWYWNRYPGARCDIDSIYYNYTFSEELLEEWNWSSRYASQPEILRYINYVADKFQLRKDIQFNTRIEAAHYDEEEVIWRIYMDGGRYATAKYFISGLGCLSASNVPSFKGLEWFQGEWYHTGRWPHGKVQFEGKRVGVIGTGSSGVQAIPIIAQEAKHLTVFQRTPQYSAPARNHAYDSEFIRKTKENYDKIKQQMRESRGGFPSNRSEQSALQDPQEKRRERFEKAWKKGGYSALLDTYGDLGLNMEANQTVSEFVREKIREKVNDPEVAEKLMPTYPYGTKRVILDTNYYETYNQKNVTLVDIKRSPIEEITPKGIKTTDAEYELDILVFATGYDAMTGPLFKLDIRGKGGISLKEKWKDGAETRTYLGIATSGFPNFYMITGPESPSVLSNMLVSIEQHVEWISDCLMNLREHGIETMEATEEAEAAWSSHCKEVANATLLAKTDSWYTGANIDGKPRGFPIYLGGVGTCREICDKVAAEGYEGFAFNGHHSV